jgi:putative phage-type endonuclease
MTTFTTEDRIMAEKDGSFTINVDGGSVQGTADWLAERLGHVTASRITDVLAKGKTGEAETRKKYKWELVAQRMTGISEDSYTNKAMEWGTDKEPDARLEYEARMGLFVDQVGFIKHPYIPFVGASPDGLIDQDGGLEIKCPNSVTHLQTIQSGKAPSKYIGQMQMGMWVTGRKWWDFVSYDPRVKKNLQFFTVRVERDDDYIANMEQEVLAFLREVEEVIFNLSGENK